MDWKNYTDNQVKWLRDYADVEFKSVREAVNKVESTNKEAVNKVETNYAEYRATQNEWRGQMKDQTLNYVTRRELWGAVVAIIGIVTGIMALLK